jgi:hypothetical protein
LWLTVTDLGDDRTGDNWSSDLRLTVADLRDDRARSRGLGLAVRDLRDNGSGGLG